MSTASPIRRLASWRATRLWLRDPARAGRLLDASGAHGAAGDGAALALRAWLALTDARDEGAAERAARAALAAGEGGDGDRFAYAALAEVLLRRGEREEAVEVLREARGRFPAVPWYELTLADALIEAGRAGEAEALLEPAAAHPQLRRHALKRLSRLALERGDSERARGRFAELVALAPDYLVYASDHETLGSLQLEAGEREAALETWRRAMEIYPRNERLRRLLAAELGEEALPSVRPRVEAVAEESAGVRRIPVRTGLITARTDLPLTVDEATRELRLPGDTVALSESVAAAAQGRVVPLELIRPGPLARLLCRFVGEIGPLHSPAGMEGAILDCGRARVLAGAIAGALGKLLGRRGWFYRVAGRRSAMIDDVAACMPPHDHHVVLGPADPDALSAQLAARLGCGFAVVDANHLSGAWVVGASAGVDRAWLAAALADNPAGNEDEGTPLVIVRPARNGEPPGPAGEDAGSPRTR